MLLSSAFTVAVEKSRLDVGNMSTESYSAHINTETMKAFFKSLKLRNRCHESRMQEDIHYYATTDIWR